MSAPDPPRGRLVDELMDVVGAGRTLGRQLGADAGRLRRAIDGNRELFTWRANVTAGDDDVRDVQIELLDGAGGDRCRPGGWHEPGRSAWTGPAFDALSSRPVCEQVQLIYASLQWLDNPQTEGM